MIKFILILIPLIIFGLLIWLVYISLKQSEKDWAICRDLEKRSLTVSTKEEIETLHNELVEEGNKINNQYIHAKLNRVEGYLRGLYKQYQP